jgi:hypothetical protein
MDKFLTGIFLKKLHTNCSEIHTNNYDLSASPFRNNFPRLMTSRMSLLPCFHGDNTLLDEKLEQPRTFDSTIGYTHM